MPTIIVSAGVVSMEISPVAVTLKAIILVVSALKKVLDALSYASAKIVQIQLENDHYWEKGIELSTCNSSPSQAAKSLLKRDLRRLGVRELCWNNFGNNDGAKESRIIPEF